MLGAVTGDIIGSAYEWHPVKTTQFELFPPEARFTDDTVLTFAVADAILNGHGFTESIVAYARRYPGRGYGKYFYRWAMSDVQKPYYSWGNGSAMRVSPTAWAGDSEEDVLRLAQEAAEVTHDHPEGIKGAKAAALAVYMARIGASKADLRRAISQRFDYDLDFTLDDLRPGFTFDVSCKATVPPAIVAFLESMDFEHAVRLAVSLGGDSDTLAAITGAIAEAYYGGVPEALRTQAIAKLRPEMLDLLTAFENRYIKPKIRPQQPEV